MTGLGKIAAANSLGVEPFGWNLRMRPNLDLTVPAVFNRVNADPIVESENEGLSEGESTIVSQYCKST